MIVLTSNSGLQGFHDPLSLSQDGSPSPIPFPWAPQTVLVWGAGPKENFHGQLWIWEKQEQQVGLHPKQSGNFIHVLNVVHLDCVPGCLHIPKAETEYGRLSFQDWAGALTISTIEVKKLRASFLEKSSTTPLLNGTQNPGFCPQCTVTFFYSRMFFCRPCSQWFLKCLS